MARQRRLYSRREFLAGVAAGLGFAAGACAPQTGAPGPAGPPAPAEVRIALIVPLSGPWARNGQLKRAGAELAVEEINQQGGIKALGGARLRLDVADAGDTVEKAVSAAQRLLSATPKPAAGIGSWLSSFTLGVTEVAERQRVPWLTLSYSDQITERGFKFVYQTSPVSSVQAKVGLEQVLQIARQCGVGVQRVALVGDNTASSVGFFEPLRKQLLPAAGLPIVVDEVWAPPLADATPIAQRLRSAQPQVVFFSATAYPDAAQVLQKVREFGVRTITIGSGAWLVLPEYVRGVGSGLVEGVMSIVAAHAFKGQEALVEKLKQKTGEPFITQDPLAGYYQVWIIKEAIELAKSAEPEKVNEALKKLDLTSGPAAENVPGKRVRFDEKGRRVDAIPLIAQWQDGIAYTVFPAEYAVREVKCSI